jgi:N-hydroxyarylamine O-acetyltransferase
MMRHDVDARRERDMQKRVAALRGATETRLRLSMSLQAFLNRIRYDGPIDTSLETLRKLQQAFLFSVPFENFDIHLGRTIRLDRDAVYRKVVEQHRGGFCYELNSLFHDMLSEMGFSVSLHGARMFREGKIGKERGHMVLIVHLAESWLVDVGNGKSAREPMRLDGGNESRAEDVMYRVGEDPVSLLEKPDGLDWRQRFVFDIAPLERLDFQPACHWTQTSEESIFTRNRICTLARPDGRVMLLNDLLTVTGRSGTTNRTVAPDEYRECLRTYFNLDINPLDFALTR